MGDAVGAPEALGDELDNAEVLGAAASSLASGTHPSRPFPEPLYPSLQVQVYIP